LTSQLNGASTLFASISRLWLAFRFCSFVLSETAKSTGLLGTPFFDRLQDFADGFGARFGAEVTFAVNADADCAGFHVAFSDYKHGVQAMQRIMARRLRIFTSSTMKDLCNEWIGMVQRLAPFNFEVQFAETAEQGNAIADGFLPRYLN